MDDGEAEDGELADRRIGGPETSAAISHPQGPHWRSRA
ncbi:hypothetical protein BMA721280_I0402 [Burkholderia mallei 2002721280]|uniref:Uncharacterized protein n=1 Tax=Burkholderia mallei (strain NCTC 10229) TaxID=412022 RepID=A2S158_BURM9|nr:hypothetical protein BMA10229_1880 [Burkholderia mallei NCTC 10229]ABO02209.1 hypothetical protein BMA10247_A0553 [Burkholderia mallei NCTC 10247]EDK86389.1 hypothetical protein BMA721280_I0402 [Burkholderia mallei 2002721280]